MFSECFTIASLEQVYGDIFKEKVVNSAYRRTFAYSFENEICKENVSCSNGNICGSTFDCGEEREEFNNGCVTAIKKYRD